MQALDSRLEHKSDVAVDDVTSTFHWGLWYKSVASVTQLYVFASYVYVMSKIAVVRQC